MIEGLKVVVKTPELKALCEQQADWHEQRTKSYREQLAGLQVAFGNEPGGEASKYTSSNVDPRESVKAKIVQHLNSARELKFIAEHLAAEETYLLDSAALAKLGIVRNSGFF